VPEYVVVTDARIKEERKGKNCNVIVIVLWGTEIRKRRGMFFF